MLWLVHMAGKDVRARPHRARGQLHIHGAFTFQNVRGIEVMEKCSLFSKAGVLIIIFYF